MKDNLRNVLIATRSKLTVALLFILWLVVCLTACEDKHKINTIGETELYFDEKVTSISAGNDGAVWIGSENGTLWKVKGNNAKNFDLGEGRIYKVISTSEESQHASLWIGVRNAGLQRWNIKGDTLHKLKTYSIPSKEDKYSPYDMAKIQQSLYIATTQGLYQLSLANASDSMRLIYPSREILAQTNEHSFIINNLHNYKDSILWAATQKGVLQLNVSSGNCQILYPELSISHVTTHNDTLFVLSDNALYFNTIEGKPLGKAVLKFSPKMYYQAAGVHYMVDRDNLILSNNFNDFTLIPLRKKISDKCRNILLPDPQNDFMLLLMEDALWRIPNHIGVFKGNSSVKVTCAGDDCAYYLTSENQLYYQQGGTSDASPIYSFPKEEQIVWMCTVGDKLFYYNTKQEVKEIAVSPFYLKNQLFHSPRTLFQSKNKITAAHLRIKKEEQFLYIGVQDGLLVLDIKQQHIDSITNFSRHYVTSFFASAHSDALYLSTLNSGVFHGSSDSEFKQIPNTSLRASVKDFIVTGDYPPRLVSLTNHHIQLQGSTHTIAAKGYNRLLYVNDSLFYALSESGVRKITIDNKGYLHDGGRFYTDLHFNPAAAFVQGQHLYLGSNQGVLAINVDKEQHTEWVSFKPNVIFSLKYILMLAFALSLLIGYAIFGYMRRKYDSKDRLIKRIAYLKTCTEELASFYNQSDEKEQNSIDQLKAGIDKLIPDITNLKELNLLIGQFTEEIIKRNREATLKLLDTLKKQIAWIATTHAFDCKQLLEKSQETLKSNDIDLIKKQVRNNETWIHDYANLEKETKQMSETLEGCAKIEGVNNLILDELKWINEESGQKSLTELLHVFQQVKLAYETMYQNKALAVILQSIANTLDYLTTRKEPDFVSIQLSKCLKEISQHTKPEERIQLLKQLGNIEKRVEFLRIKDKIEDCMEQYTLLHDKRVDENEQLINKKFDKELESLIAEETKGCVEKLERLIVSMYKLLGATDPMVLTDLLKISNSYHQQAKVLALLIANPRVKRSLIPGLLGIYGNLNPVISRLVNNKIKTHEENLKAYIKEDPLQATLVYYVLKLID